MRTLAALLRCELVLQVRNGFWASGLAVTATWILLLRALAPPYRAIWLPCVLYLDIAVIGMMFIAGILYFDRRQGVIDALVVTPVRTSSWLASKVLSLTLLATTVALALALSTEGLGVDWPRLVPYFALVSAFFTVAGFLVASRFQSVGAFLAAFGALGLPLALPMLDYFDVWDHPVLWLNPAHPAMVLIRDAFRPGTSREAGVALVLVGIWVVLGFRAGVCAFHRRVSWRRGAA